MNKTDKRRTAANNLQEMPTGEEREAIMGCDGVQFFVDQILRYGVEGQDYVRTVLTDGTVELDLGDGVVIEISECGKEGQR